MSVRHVLEMSRRQMILAQKLSRERDTDRSISLTKIRPYFYISALHYYVCESRDLVSLNLLVQEATVHGGNVKTDSACCTND